MEDDGRRGCREAPNALPGSPKRRRTAMTQKTSAVSSHWTGPFGSGGSPSRRCLRRDVFTGYTLRSVAYISGGDDALG